MSLTTLKQLWDRPLVRAVILHLSLLGGGWAIAVMIASALGLSVSLLGILLAYAIVNIALTAWLLRRKSEVQLEQESDETAEAIASFAQDPLGALIGDAKDRLAGARRGVGRQAAMYQPLDRLVRVTRKIERRLALDSDLRPGFSRSLTRDLPVIAATAEQYVRLKEQNLSDAQESGLIVAEGVLREAADRLDALARSEGKVDSATIGLIRMDANTEFLAESLSADTISASRKAAALRTSHALGLAAKEVSDELAGDLHRVSDWITGMAAEDGEALNDFLASDSASLIESAQAVVDNRSEAAEDDLRAAIAGTSVPRTLLKATG